MYLQEEDFTNPIESVHDEIVKKPLKIMKIELLKLITSQVKLHQFMRKIKLLNAQFVILKDLKWEV